MMGRSAGGQYHKKRHGMFESSIIRSLHFSLSCRC